VLHRALRPGLPRRAAIAASSLIAVGGTLAVTAAASAAQMPFGAVGDAPYSGVGPATSLYAIANTTPAPLASAAQMLDTAGDTAMANGGSPWAASDINASNAGQIVADFSGKPVFGYTPTSGSYLAGVKSSDPTYKADLATVTNLGQLYASIQVLSIGDLPSYGGKAYPGGPYSVDGNTEITSKATVTGVGKPVAYTMTLKTTGAATATGKTGYIIPQSETFTYPKDFGINLSVLKDEVPYADINDPASAGKPVGTLTSRSPLAQIAGGTGTTVTGSVYLVKNANPKNLVPYMVLEIGSNVSVLGTLSGVTFPLTVTFSTPTVFGGALTLPVPLSNLTVSFPAATSPFVVNSCTKISSPTGAVTDFLSPYAPAFGDYSDGDASGLNQLAGAVRVPSTKTVLTNACPALKASHGSASGVARGKPHFGFRLSDNAPFSSFTVGLPPGFSYRKFSAADIKVSGTTGSGAYATAVKVKRVAIKRGTLTVTLSGPTKQVGTTITGGIAETKAAEKDRSVTLRLGATGKTVALTIRA
jgi:hypothetical protein